MARAKQITAQDLESAFQQVLKNGMQWASMPFDTQTKRNLFDRYCRQSEAFSAMLVEIAAQAASAPPPSPPPAPALPPPPPEPKPAIAPPRSLAPVIADLVKVADQVAGNGHDFSGDATKLIGVPAGELRALRLAAAKLR